MTADHPVGQSEQELRAVYRALDGQTFADGGKLATAIFKTYQKLFAPTMPLGEYAAMLTAGLERGWVIIGPGSQHRVAMPAGID
jgi:hypothetical protein